MRINIETIKNFINEMQQNEYSSRTIKKYETDAKKMMYYLNGKEVERCDVIRFKESLCTQYKPRSVNSILAACNHLFEYVRREDLKVKQLKIQQEVFCPENRELTKAEYKKLVTVANRLGRYKIALIMQTICSTGIRISELEFITVKAVKEGRAEIRLKGKNRVILIQNELQKKLLYFLSKEKIKTGSIFVTKAGNPCDRCNLWKEMKIIAEKSKICLNKVFPHNLRHLFAREFYKIRKDIVHLADVLGHCNINTTRIYLISTGKEHKKTLQKMQLII